jgi:hypothetical protein
VTYGLPFFVDYFFLFHFTGLLNKILPAISIKRPQYQSNARKMNQTSAISFKHAQDESNSRKMNQKPEICSKPLKYESNA